MELTSVNNFINFGHIQDHGCSLDCTFVLISIGRAINSILKCICNMTCWIAFRKAFLASVIIKSNHFWCNTFCLLVKWTDSIRHFLWKKWCSRKVILSELQTCNHEKFCEQTCIGILEQYFRQNIRDSNVFQCTCQNILICDLTPDNANDKDFQAAT